MRHIHGSAKAREVTLSYVRDIREEYASDAVWSEMFLSMTAAVIIDGDRNDNRLIVEKIATHGTYEERYARVEDYVRRL